MMKYIVLFMAIATVPAIGQSNKSCDQSFFELNAELSNYSKFDQYFKIGEEKSTITKTFLDETMRLKSRIDAFINSSKNCALYTNYLKGSIEKIAIQTLWNVKLNDYRRDHSNSYFQVVATSNILYQEYIRFKNEQSIAEVDKKLKEEIDSTEKRLLEVIDSVVKVLDPVVKQTANIVQKKADSVYRKIQQSDNTLSLANKKINEKIDTVNRVLTDYGKWYLGGGLHTTNTIGVSATLLDIPKLNQKKGITPMATLSAFYKSEDRNYAGGGLTVGLVVANVAIQPVGIVYLGEFSYSMQLTVFNNGTMISVSYSRVTGAGLSLLLGIRNSKFVP